jgi:hypothetical protein
MNASQSAETYARQVAGLPSVEEKIDRLARAIVELAVAVQGIERRCQSACNRDPPYCLS